MFLDKFLSKIGDVFSSLFNSAKKTWVKLSPEVQNAMLHGSAVFAAINKFRDAAPDFIIDFLTKKYPDLPVEKLFDGLTKVSLALNIAEGINSPDLETTIKNLQAYFASKKDDGKIWATLSHAAASILAVILAPAGTKVAVVISLIEYVFQDKVKGDMEEKEAA